MRVQAIGKARQWNSVGRWQDLEGAEMASRIVMWLFLFACVAGLLYGYRLYDEAGKMMVDETADLEHAEERMAFSDRLVPEDWDQDPEDLSVFEQPVRAAYESRAAGRSRYETVKSAYDEAQAIQDERYMSAYASGVAGGVSGLIFLGLLIRTLGGRKD